MKVNRILGDWLFATLAGTFVEGATLYVPNGTVSEGVLNIDAAEQDGSLVGYSLTNGRVFPIVVKENVKTPYVTYDNITVNYVATKDGSEPDNLTCRVLCVDRGYRDVEMLADAVEAMLNNAWVEGLRSTLLLDSRRSDYDPATGEFLEEMRFSITI